MDSRKCQTVTVSPAKPAGFPLLDNVGKTIALRDFDRERDDLSPLAQALSAGGRDGESLLDAILGWSGGYPFLTLQLCQDCLQRGMDSPQAIDRFANYDKALAEENFQEHFQQITNFLDQRLANQGRTLALYQRILAGRKVADGPSRLIIELKLSGLIRRDDHGRLVVRNRIYRKIFDADWGRGTKPLRTVRYLAWTSAIAVTLILAWGVWWGYDSLYLEPERREVARLIEEIDRTQDPEQAERFAGYLRGEHADPGLGHVIRGQQAVAAAALTRYRRRKKQAIGRDLLTALEETADKAKAKDLFQWLAGQRPPPELGRPLRGFEAQADEGYQAFWERRADKLEKSAQVRLAAGHLILAAAAARKT